MHCYRLLLAPFALVATLAMPAAAQAPQSWTQVGALSCQVDPNVGFIIVGSQSMRCLFTPNTSQEREAYAGALNTVGLNVGISAGGVLGWAVFAPTAGLPHGALAGEYVGVSGDVGIGLGAGANVLLGGSNRTVALQPISLQGSIALNVVVGVSSLKLRPLPM
jgi:predicted MFS family arabinose efflux permease